ncbi:MAG: hypothetical protein H7Z72_24400 [Bacteroidetes bacterium]|nr:hypothetical protein [Fibrella sp.]
MRIFFYIHGCFWHHAKK